MSLMSNVSLSEFVNQLSTGTLVAIGILIVINYTLLVWAIVRVVKSPIDRVRYGSKVLWIVVALLLNGFGPIIVLALSILPPTVDESVSRISNAPVEVADLLYPTATVQGDDDE